MLELQTIKEDRNEIYRRAIEECGRMLGDRKVVPEEVWSKQFEDACRLHDQVKEEIFPHIRVVKIPFNKKNYIEKEALHLDDDTISSKYFVDYTPKSVDAMYIVLMWIEEIVLDSYLDQFYIHLWQIAYMNVMREYVREYFVEEGTHISPFYGPGLYDIPLGELKKLYKRIEVKQVKIHGQKMEPSSSFLGFIFSGQHCEIQKAVSCKECLGVTGCEFCMLYESRRKKEEA